MCDQPSISPGSKPVKLRSKSAELWSSSLRLSSPGDASVDHQTKGFYMGRRPLIAKQYRHFGYAELALCFQPQVRICTLAIAAASSGF
jgi:hypothetical protein